MFKIIGFIPQTSQGLFSFEDKYFSINPPFKKFSVISILKSEINDSLPYIKEYAYYDELEFVFQHFEKMHLLEMLNNEKLISTLTHHILKSDEQQINLPDSNLKSTESLLKQEKLEKSSQESSLVKRALKVRSTKSRMMSRAARAKPSKIEKAKKKSATREKKIGSSRNLPG